MRINRLFSKKSFYLFWLLFLIIFNSAKGQFTSTDFGVINPDMLISHYGNHSAYFQSEPSAASNGTDGYFVCWLDFRDGYYDVWGQRFDASEQTIGPNFRISDDPSIKLTRGVKCAMNSHGYTFVIWNVDYNCFGKIYSAAGEIIKPEFRIGGAGLSGNGIDVVALTNSDFVVAYSYDIGDEIYVQKFDETGQELTDKITVYQGEGQSQEKLKLCANETVIFLTWYNNVSYNDKKILTVPMSVDLNTVQNPILVTEALSILWKYGAVINSDGNLEVYNVSKPDNFYRIQRTIISSGGVVINGPMNVSSDLSYNFSEIEVLQKEGTYTVLGCLYRGHQLCKVQVSNAGVASDLVVIGDDLGNYTLNNSKADLDITDQLAGNKLIVFRDRRKYFGNDPNDPNTVFSFEEDIYGQFMDGAGNKIGENFLINDDYAAGIDVYASVGIDGDNSKLISWQYRDYDNPEVLAQKVGSNGSLQGRNILINEDPDSLEQMIPSTAIGYGTKDIVVWADYRRDNTQGLELFAQLFNKDGSKSGGNFLAVSGMELAIEDDFVVAAKPDGGFFLLWLVRNDSWQYDLKGTSITESGTISQEIVGISPVDSGLDCMSPDIGFDADGNAYISYVEKTDNRIVYQIFDAAMDPVTELLTAFNANGFWFDGGTNSIAVAPDGSFWILTTDYNILLQQFYPSGEKNGDVIQVEQGTPYWANSAYPSYPGMAVSPTGNRVVVAWRSDKYSRGFPKLLASIVSEGSPGTIEIINQQGIKENAHAYFWKHGVACNNDQIVFTWSENRTDHNLDVYCKATDWSLTTIEEFSTKEAGFSVWPNPAEDYLYLDDHSKEFFIYNLEGRLIRKVTEPYWDLKDDSHARVPAGMYLIKNERNITKKVIVH